MRYVALLRGIAPSDPRMKNDKLRSVFESLGFDDVKSVISSGNIIFSSATKPSEDEIEQTIKNKLEFFSSTIVRSEGEVQQLLQAKPFGELQHSPKSYLLVTFLKHAPNHLPFAIPYESPDASYRVIGYDKEARTVFTVTDQTVVKTPNVMVWLEQQFSKEISSRTWKTVEKIYDKM